MKHLTRFVAFLVLFIACVGFTLSYRALYEYGLANGVNPDLAWLWPLIVDGFMLVISLSILRASLLQEPTLYLWLLAGLAIVVSIAFNIAHAPATVAGRAVAMIAPLAMFGSFEVFIGQIRRNSERVGMQESYKGLQAHAKELQERVNILQAAELTAQGSTQNAISERNTAQAETDKARKELSRLNKEIANALQDDTRSKLIMYYKVNPGASQSDAAEFAGVTRTRVGQYLEQFREAGILNGAIAAHPNGKAHKPAGAEKVKV